MTAYKLLVKFSSIGREGESYGTRGSICVKTALLKLYHTKPVRVKGPAIDFFYEHDIYLQ